MAVAGQGEEPLEAEEDLGVGLLRDGGEKSVLRQ